MRKVAVLLLVAPALALQCNPCARSVCSLRRPRCPTHCSAASISQDDSNSSSTSRAGTAQLERADDDAAPQEQQHFAEDPWNEVEDWLLQDTFARFAIGSGKHVLWRRMVQEVPELVNRSPDDARQRWLHLTGRQSSQSAAAAAAVGGKPATDSFYVQPPLLENWLELDDGTFEGTLSGWQGLSDGITVRTSGVELQAAAAVVMQADCADYCTKLQLPGELCNQERPVDMSASSISTRLCAYLPLEVQGHKQQHDAYSIDCECNAECTNHILNLQKAVGPVLCVQPLRQNHSCGMCNAGAMCSNSDAAEQSKSRGKSQLWQIHGKSYDLAAFLELHPGGRE
eukprot:17347-Heterococcus_DN1.PRE.1